jgi:O-antigen ligase
VPSLVLFLLGIGFWASAGRRLIADPVQRRWILVIACLAVPALASLPTSQSPRHTAIQLLLIFGMFVLGSVLVEILRRPGALELLQKIMAVVLAIWIVDAIVQMVLGVDLLGIPQNGEGGSFRVVGMYGNHLYLPWSLVLALPVLLWALIERHPYYTLGLLLLGGIVIIGTGVRSAFVAWFVVAFFCFLHIRLHRKWLLVGVLGAVLAGVVMLSPIAQQKLKATSIDAFTFEQMNSLLSYRPYLWETAWAMFSENPVAGVGGDAFRSVYGEYSVREDDPFRPGRPIGPQHAHQLYLSIMAETGLIGSIGIVLLWALLTRWYFSAGEGARARARPHAIGLLAVAFPINSQPLIYKTWWAPLLVLFVAALLAAVGNPRGEQAVTD